MGFARLKAFGTMLMIEQLLPILVPLILTGILSGFLAGLLGVGGGIIIVPILAYLLEASGLNTQTPMHVAIGSSLAIIVPTSLISARSHTQLGNVDRDVIKQLGPFVFLGALGGAIVANGFDNAALKIVFGALAVLISLSFLMRVIVLTTGLPAMPLRSFLGGVIGLISSLVGIGGGLFNGANISLMWLADASCCWLIGSDGACDRYPWNDWLYDCGV